MNSYWLWIPSWILVGLAAALLGTNFLLYKRWRTLNYLYFIGVSMFTIFLQIILSLGAGFLHNSELFRTVAFAFTSSSLLMLQAIIQYYFQPGMRKELYATGISAILFIFSILISQISLVVGAIFILITLAVYTTFFIKKILPFLPKRHLLQRSLFLFLLGSLALLINMLFSVPALIFVGLIIMGAAFFVQLIIFYDRIVDMVEAVSYSAVTDGLTGLFNKGHLLKKLQDFIQQGKAYALVFSDIDNFKRLNDTQGHQIGDEILKLVARAMNEIFKEVGLVGRYGGEELVAIVTSSRADPRKLAEAFRAKVEDVTQSIYPVTVSVGFSLNEEGISVDEFIRQADEAMYISKKSGKNCVSEYDDGDMQTVVD